MDWVECAQQFMQAKDAAKAAGQMKDTDRTVMARIPELSNVAKEYAEKSKATYSGG
jgi:hypothetical protein